MSEITSASLRCAPISLGRPGEPFDHNDSIFELKYDGVCALAELDSGRCRLISRNHHELTTFQELCTAIGQALLGQLVLGEGWLPPILRSDAPAVPQYFYAFRRMARICEVCR